MLELLKKYQVINESELANIAADFVNITNEDTIFLFYGEMGAGKTTFIKCVCKALGVSETVSSPTFSIVNEYRTSDKKILYHFDFYRLKNEEEAYDIGAEEYFYSGNKCFIEWPSQIPNLLPENYIEVKIENNKGIRTIFVNKLT